jgi:pimeloyl-ACP methyl ester carboxylesterase
VTANLTKNNLLSVNISVMHPILLLHGALGAKTQLEPLAGLLRQRYEVHLINFSGHGGVASEGAFSIACFAAEAAQYLDDRQLPALPVFGYSMGGYVAMYLARHMPGRLSRIITLGTKYHWDEGTAAREAGMLDPALIEEKTPAFAEALRQRHAPADWKALLRATAALMQALGSAPALEAADYAAITQPCLLMVGDRDKMVTLQETVAVYKALPEAQLAVLPATPHPLEKVDTALLATFIQRFATP